MTPLQRGMIKAQMIGRMRFTGPPCKVCANETRYACNGRCVICSNRVTTEWHRTQRAKAKLQAAI